MRRLLPILALAACQGSGALMAPGSDCLACHSPGGGAHAYSAAGTVYGRPDAIATAGVEGATVVITDADGRRLALSTNAAGNFYTDAPLAFPAVTEVRLGPAVRHMEPGLSDGSCGACHTVPGSRGAEGRVYLRAIDVPPSDGGVVTP